MSKIRSRFRPAEQNGLQNAWNNLLNAFDDYTVQRADDVLAALRRSIINKINETAGSNARLDGFDEKAYEYYKNLMSYYESIVKSYEESRNDVNSRQLKTILDGVYSILSASLQDCKPSETADSPVQAEIKQMILGSINGFIEDFDELSSRYKQSVGLGHNDFSAAKKYTRERLLDGFTEDCADDTVRFVFYSVKDTIGKSCYELYTNVVIACDANLNDLDTRHVASHYFMQLDKEYGILNSLVVTQIRAIEENTRGRGAKEVLIAHRIMQSLREAYQYFGRNVVDVLTYFKSKQDSGIEHPDIISEESFTEEVFGSVLERCLHTEAGGKSFEEAAAAWKKELRKKVKDTLRTKNAFSISAAAYKLHRAVAECDSMAADMITAFEKILAFYKENEESYKPLGEFEIISGINETIEIKIESLAENKKLFMDGMLTMIGSLSKLDTGFSDEEISEQTEQASGLWKDCFLNSPEGFQSALEMFEHKLKETESNKARLQTFARAFGSQEDRINKKITEFLRTQILFEASTFEEIINYSVSHLKDSEEEPVKVYYEHIGLISDNVEAILKRNNIQIIKPAPHEQFNGKEHEVLMAESSEEFKKGEIIKLMNSGYKQNETVLVRANVIAAK